MRKNPHTPRTRNEARWFCPVSGEGKVFGGRFAAGRLFTAARTVEEDMDRDLGKNVEKTGDSDVDLSEAMFSIHEIESLLGDEEKGDAVSEDAFAFSLEETLAILPKRHIVEGGDLAQHKREVILKPDALFHQLARGKVEMSVAQIAFSVPADLLAQEAYSDNTMVTLPLSRVVAAVNPSALGQHMARMYRRYRIEEFADPFKMTSATVAPEGQAPAAEAAQPAAEEAPTPVEPPVPVVAGEAAPLAPAAEAAQPAAEEAPAPVEPPVPVVAGEAAPLAPAAEAAQPAAEEAPAPVEPPVPVVAGEAAPLAPAAEAAQPAVEEAPAPVEPPVPVVAGEAAPLAPAAEAAQPAAEEAPAPVEPPVLPEQTTPIPVAAPAVSKAPRARTVPDPAGPAVESHDTERLGGVNLNTASQEQLLALDGMSASLAKNIVERREKDGPFKDIFELHDMPGVGRKTFQRITGMPYNAGRRHRAEKLARMLGLPVCGLTHLPGVVRSIAEKMSFSGCVLTDQDGLLLAESRADEYAEAFSAVTPRLMQQIKENLRISGMVGLDSVSLCLGERMVTVACCGRYYLSCVHVSRRLTKGQLAFFLKAAAEIAWLLSRRGYVAG